MDQHPKGAIQLAPGRRPAGKRNGKIFDPCGRTLICWCDHKGRKEGALMSPPVFDRGLAEWHPSGAQ